MRSFSRSLFLVSLSGALVPSACLGATPAASDEPISLRDALNLARTRNGSIQSAMYQVDYAKAVVDQSLSAFLPVITPQYQYNSVRNVGGGFPTVSTSGWAGTLGASWTVLDAGQRDLVYRSNKRNLAAAKDTSVQTLRTTLYTVTQQYYDALRAQELEKVSGTQVDRAKTILDQTDARILVRDAAKIERLQANADYQNAKVQALSAHNQVTNSSATLKATIGFDSNRPLPPLHNDAIELTPLPDTVVGLIEEGLRNRPDLQAQRLSIEAQDLLRQQAVRNAGIGFALTINNTYQFTPSGGNDRNLTVLASYPLFDGGLTRSIVREYVANIASARALLVQAERSARAEIEADYAADRTDREILAAAQVALDAAQENYRFAVDSRDKGASDLLTVITAQVSLVTAESNFIQAQYDARVADVQLLLVTGRPIPGETAS